MRARWGAALAAALAVAAGAQAENGGTCELSRVADRRLASSERCVSCHDGTGGTTIALQLHPTDGGPETSHPVEVDYGAAWSREPRRYAPGAALPREVPLVHGKVACTTCHDGASPRPNHVAAVRDLCAACHLM